jgi:DNA-binding MarR family transcriptional regulator
MTENSFVKSLQQWSGVFARRTIHDFLAFAHEFDVSMPQIEVLMRLYYQGPASILAVRQDLYGSRAAATQMIDKLVQMGLVERSEDPDDRRVKRIRLTDQGRELVAQGIAARRHWLVDLAEALTPEEQDLFAGMLDRLTQAAMGLEANHPAVGESFPGSVV